RVEDVTNTAEYW
nr:Chain C, ARG-VAL-GLU-ASP-VAL-THR-ASN-THR-ALA-GLU-TYR-TRP [Equine infectious anemia virus]4ZUV_F Chain F, ARG-VAL-GLU-ASP-VAL-THR-ASN-THR-ALA-GLU-TYR-TRP [Equine infectious anemia virus]6LF8_C Chain C, ARG-VAL-GLU-ASP-VAL-THR-ASN-THR-ALA-GLU-TYR-TRP [unidentified influenza virus]6LF9_C Chain C, ARG-VAL-GLU-ASP-VAL-THR-ASN-THR-ALA-GLU-TYR-TRP [synthetic construct]6LF9_F Chain F, ARG-VAL-GLU-ASP-VAL-THR-ASN-THR-ALA-GLU-TYR-TRP [synthetic construct]6LF9_I Chain I, ARG-VAL-GLU-ASP-VAL-THR-ASN-TH